MADRFFADGFSTLRRRDIRHLIVALLITCVPAVTAFGQTIPNAFLGGIMLDEPLPTQFTTGVTHWVSGGVIDEGISSLLFQFSSAQGPLEHRARVVRGRFEHPLVFKHADAGERAFRVTIFRNGQAPFTTEPFAGIQIVEGDGEIERPWAYYDGFIDDAYFLPNAMGADAHELPPLFVTTSGRVETVSVFLPDDLGGLMERMLSDDGMAGDLEAGDGVFTMAHEHFDVPDFGENPFGNVSVGIVYTDAEGTTRQLIAECGLVDGPVDVHKLSNDVFLADHVVNLVDDGTLFVLSHPFSDLRAVGRRFYEHFSDDYDFLVVRSALPLTNAADGLTIDSHNDVAGIGLPLFDISEEFGSAGQLQSATLINFRLLGPVVHEIAHNWANFLNLFGGSFWRGHWGFSDVEGVLGGNANQILALGDGQYAIPRNSATSQWGGRYSMLELYLMGLVPAEEVPPHLVLAAPQVLSVDEESDLLIVAATLDTVTIGEVIDIYGPRSPSPNDAPRAFRMATVVVSDHPLNPIELAYHDRQAEWFGSDRDNFFAFAAATGYRATMDTRLVPPITAVLDDDAIATTDGLPGSSPELEQNFPNPFNASTTWRYTLSSAARPSLDIYATNGQRVKTILQGRREAGRYTIDWDGTDDNGHSLATGVYLARLQAGEAVVVRKLTLVR